jgi:hypothetical protein
MSARECPGQKYRGACRGGATRAEGSSSSRLWGLFWVAPKALGRVPAKIAPPSGVPYPTGTKSRGIKSLGLAVLRRHGVSPRSFSPINQYANQPGGAECED